MLPCFIHFPQFRFADGLDITLMILGLLASLVNGACLPVMSLILGEMSDNLISGCLVKTNTSEYNIYFSMLLGTQNY